MPKQRNSSAAKKRFIVLKSGKVKRGHQNKRHLLSTKETGRKRKLRQITYVEGKQIKTVKQIVGKQD